MLFITIQWAKDFEIVYHGNSALHKHLILGVGGIDKFSTSVISCKNIPVLLHTYYWSR